MTHEPSNSTFTRGLDQKRPRAEQLPKFAAATLAFGAHGWHYMSPAPVAPLVPWLAAILHEHDVDSLRDFLPLDRIGGYAVRQLPGEGEGFVQVRIALLGFGAGHFDGLADWVALHWRRQQRRGFLSGRGRHFDSVVAARQQSAYRSEPHPVAWRGHATFRKEGEIWTIAYGAKTLRLKDAKGLRYLAYLLAHPGERIHVHDLVLIIEGSAAGSGASAKSFGAVSEVNLNIVRELGDAGVELDRRARTEYRDTLRELRAELDQAENFNDSGRAEHIRREIDFIESELSSSAAIGGRDRVSAAHIERARGMVSKRIRATLAKIGDKDRSLASHFAASIKTGYFCAYLPEPDRKISWQL